MAEDVLLFLSMRAEPGFADRSLLGDLTVAADALRRLLQLSFSPALRGIPSLDFELHLEGVDGQRPATADDILVFALQPLNAREAAELQIQTRRANLENWARDVSVNLDLPVAPSDSWCPDDATFPLFGQRELALAQISAEAAAARGALGADVNLVVVDQGIDRGVLQSRFQGLHFNGGWKVPEFGKGGPPGPGGLKNPGTWPDGHATKMAEIVLSVTPQVNILDLPLLPSRILDLRGYLSWATAVYWTLPSTILWLRAWPRYRGPWVFCNAWAVFDLASDPPLPSPFNYGQNPLHAMNMAVAQLPQLDLADIVFSAGNCGQFCPDHRCGIAQIGPGRSIYGVAAVPEVLTLSAVRSDTLWLGYSSQGPAPPLFGSSKPDLCAPSQFAGPADWGRSYTGTSTSCALAAAAMAAARSYAPTQQLTPAQLHARALTTARPPAQPSPQPERFGAGILDIGALL